MPTHADAVCEGSLGVGTVNVTVTLLYVPCAGRQHTEKSSKGGRRTLGEFQVALAQWQLDEYSAREALLARGQRKRDSGEEGLYEERSNKHICRGRVL